MDAFIRRLEQISMAIASLIVVAIMVIITWDAAGRYLFREPLSWAFDVVSNYLLTACAYLALSSTFQRGYHINIELLHAKLSPRGQALAGALTSTLAAIAFLAVAYASGLSVIETYQRNEFYPGVIPWPSWISFVPIPVGCLILALRLLHHTSQLLRHGRDPEVGPEADGNQAMGHAE